MGFDIYAHVTELILHELESTKVTPWAKQWIGDGGAFSHGSGRPYSLLNSILLGKPGEWATYRQIQAEGGHVRKGEKSRMVVFWKWIDVVDEDTGDIEQRPFLRYFNVFELAQTEGIQPRKRAPMPDAAKRHEEAERILHAYWEREHIHIRQVPCDECSYSPSRDEITLPLMKQFLGTEGYYGSAAHESIHSTGRAGRLSRLERGTHFGSEAYSKEELVAEMGAAFLIHRFGLQSPKDTQNHAAYIASWLRGALKNDKRFVVSAAGSAEKAVNYILHGSTEVQQDIVERGE